MRVANYFLFLSILSFNLYAIEDVSHFQLKTKRESQSIFGHLGFRSNHMVDNVGEVPGNASNMDFDFNYKSETSRAENRFAFKSILNNESNLMVSVPEAYVRRDLGPSKFYYGRSILTWSDIDSYWGLGKLNNRVNFDFYQPGQEGLVGVQYVYSKPKGVFVSAFASFLYLPEMNPSLDIDDKEGTISCRNPWCKAPTKTTVLKEKEVPIKYKVNMPNISELVVKYTLGANIGYRNKYTEISLFGIRKPENKVSATAELSFNQEPEIAEEDWVSVEIQPEIYYHDVVGGNVKLKGTGVFNGLELYGSALGVYPNANPEGERIVFEYTGIRSEKRKEEYLGGGLNFKRRRVNAGVHYMARISSFDHEEDDILVELPRWNQTVGLSADVMITQTFTTSFDYKYDMITDDRITSFSMKKQFGRDLLTMVGVNIIGAPTNQSFWSDYRNNDGVFAGVKLLY